MSLHFCLRPARASDANTLAVLAAQVWLDTYATDGVSSMLADYVLQEINPAKFASRLAEPAMVVLVAEHAENLVGFAALRIGVPCPAGGLATVELETLYVQSHFLAQGVGSTLLRQAQLLVQAQADSAGSGLWLTVNSKNQRAIAFYNARGYQMLGTQMFMLGGVEHENLVMEQVSPQKVM